MLIQKLCDLVTICICSLSLHYHGVRSASRRQTGLGRAGTRGAPHSDFAAKVFGVYLMNTSSCISTVYSVLYSWVFVPYLSTVCMFISVTISVREVKEFHLVLVLIRRYRVRVILLVSCFTAL